MSGGAAGPGFGILTDELTTHASKVSGYADRMRTAADAARQVSMNDSAFGVICQPFAMMLTPFENMGVDALTRAAETLQDTEASLKDTVTSYTTTDTAESGALGRLYVD